jgi:hypothetical protein
MSTTDIVAANQGQAPAPLSPTNYAMAVEELTTQVDLIQQVMKSVMHEKEHYGTIPGCGTKPTLLKPGAEKLAMTFRFAPKYEIQERDMANGHREYRVVCALQSIITGAFVGEGVGAGTTMESKYRFRKAEQTCPLCGQPAIIRGKKEYGGGWLCYKNKGGCGAKFKDGDPEIENQEMGRIEHDNPADYYNTVLKMAKKRALVDAVLTATAASDIFTQDVEDLGGKHPEEQPEKRPGDSTQQANNTQEYASSKQLGFLNSVANKAGFDDQEVLVAARRFLKDQNLNDLNTLYPKEASSLIDAIKSGRIKPARAMDRMDEMPMDTPGMDPTAADFLAHDGTQEASNA